MKNVKYIHLYFQVHQPRRLRPVMFLDIKKDTPLFDDVANERIMRRIARQCYLPANLLLLRLIRKFPTIKVTFSVSGLALEQLAQYAPAALESFSMLASTGNVEFLAETYYHSLAFLKSREEFIQQVTLHQQAVTTQLGVIPTVFRNTELIYTDTLGKEIAAMGFTGTLIDRIDRLIKIAPAHHLYQQPDSGLRLLLRNYKLSDDVAFRFSDPHWKEWPLTAQKYIDWLEHTGEDESVINLGMDYETFGEHQHSVTGIFRFLEQLLSGIASHSKLKMVTAAEAIAGIPAAKKLRIHSVISWADAERDLSGWLGNDMQRDAFDNLYALEEVVKKTNNSDLINQWRYLQTSDHFYYMSTKTDSDGQTHRYFSPFGSPHEAFIQFMNALTVLSLRLDHERAGVSKKRTRQKSLTSSTAVIA